MALRSRVQYTHYRGHKRTQEPAAEPVSLDDVKDQLRIEDDADDALLSLYIQSAREQCEEVTGLALIEQQWRMTLDQWPGQGEPWWDGVKQMAISELRSSARPFWVILPRYPLIDAESVTTYDQDGDPSTVDLSDFIVDREQQPGRIVLRSTATWPIALQRANAVEIDYTAGFGPDSDSVPAALRVALMQMVATMYEHRGDDCSAEDAMRRSGALAVFNRWKVHKV